MREDQTARTAPVDDLSHIGEALWRESDLLRWRKTKIVASILFLAFVVWSVLSPYSIRLRVDGRVTPSQGTATITAPEAGRIEQARPESAIVPAGQTLFAIATDLRTGEGLQGQTLANADAAEGKALEAKARAQLAGANTDRQASIRNAALLKGMIGSIDAQQREVTEKVAILDARIKALKGAYDKGFVSAVQYEEFQLAQKDAQIQVSSLGERRSQLERELATEQAKLQGYDANVLGARAVNEQELSRLTRAQAEGASRRHIVLTAPFAGRLTNVHVSTGGVVAKGEVLGAVVPDGPLEVELYVPSRAIPFVKIGAPVKVMYEAFPYQRYGLAAGHVFEVSTSPIDQAEGPGKAAFYLVKVRMDRVVRDLRGGRPLTPGERVSTFLVLERRPIIAWLLDPFAKVVQDARLLNS